MAGEVRFDTGDQDRFVVILTDKSRLSNPSRSFVRSHAAKWSKPSHATAKRPIFKTTSAATPTSRKGSIAVSKRSINAVTSSDRKKIDGKPQRTPALLSFTDHECQPEGYTATTSSPQTWLDSSLLDPFDTSQTRIDENATVLLKYYANDLVNTFYISAAAAEKARREYVQNALSDPACLHAMAYRALGEIQGWQLVEETSPLAFRAADEKYGVTHAQYKHATVSFLSQTLPNVGNRVPESTICAVLLLLAGEVFQGDINGMKAQLAGLKVLVDIDGGLHTLQAAIIHPVMTISILAAALLRQQPSISPIKLPDDTISLKTSALLESCPCPALARVGSSFLTKFRLIGSRLLEIILSRRKFTIFHELQAQGVIELDDLEFEYFYAQIRNIEYELVRLCGQLLCNNIREVIRLALLTFSYGSFARLQKSTSAYSYAFVAQLKEALHKTELKDCWRPDTDILSWCLFLGAHASESRRERTWYIAQLARSLDELGLSGVEEFRHLLEGFFFIARVHEQSLIDIWGAADLLRSAIFS